MSRPRVGVIGGGSAAEALARATKGVVDMTIFEPELVGGECPFLACMPSKSMLHDARTGAQWQDAIRHRRRITNDLDDSGHADDLSDMGVRLLRERGVLIDASTVEADGARHQFDHLVLATGAAPIIPEIDGIDDCRDAIWTSADVYRSTERPDRVLIVGAGVIGLEAADMFGRFGSSVTMVDPAERPLELAPPDVGDIVTESLTALGVDIRSGVEATSMRPARDGQTNHAPVGVTLSDGTTIEVDRVVIAIGRRPRTNDIDIETIGLDPSEPLPVESNGRVRCAGSVWAIGDVAGLGQYTHLANHQAAIVADHLVGTATRRFDDEVLASCMFTSPPFIEVGPSWSELVDDPDIVAVGRDLGGFPRATSDRLGPGHLWIAARRSTGLVVAASGAGPSFDELVHAIVIAIDGAVPVSKLRRSMQPFPTIGEILGPIWNELHDELSS